MNHDGLLVDGEGGVGWDGDPIVYVGVSDIGLTVSTWVVGGEGVWVRRKGERKGGWLRVGGESEKKKKRVKGEKKGRGGKKERK